MSEMKRIAVVGASLAGLRAVEFIRRAKFEGELVLIGDEAHLPYDRPPLSKAVLAGTPVTRPSSLISLPPVSPMISIAVSPPLASAAKVSRRTCPSKGASL